jgi:hypothetical protein
LGAPAALRAACALDPQGSSRGLGEGALAASPGGGACRRGPAGPAPARAALLLQNLAIQPKNHIMFGLPGDGRAPRRRPAWGDPCFLVLYVIIRYNMRLHRILTYCLQFFIIFEYLQELSRIFDNFPLFSRAFHCFRQLCTTTKAADWPEGPAPHGLDPWPPGRLASGGRSLRRGGGASWEAAPDQAGPGQAPDQRPPAACGIR